MRQDIGICFVSLLLKLYKNRQDEKSLWQKNKNSENKFKRRIV